MNKNNVTIRLEKKEDLHYTGTEKKRLWKNDLRLFPGKSERTWLWCCLF